MKKKTIIERTSLIVKEDDKYWYVDCNAGLGVGTYPKIDFTMQEAIFDQQHLGDEQEN